MRIKYPAVGVCGLSCRLCPWYHSKGKSRCEGCKSKFRMTAGCPFITCAVKRKKLEFCWDCTEKENCKKWQKHRDAGKKFDSFTCYQKLEDNIAYIQKNGLDNFDRLQKRREQILKEMLQEFNEGRSKTYYCIASTVLEIKELQAALKQAKKAPKELDLKGKARFLHAILDNLAERKHYFLKLRK
ncbi:MAG: DUF3795 domain-containing protein [Candidatus Bathyarchaeota archaeon]|nr:DUF3795 domain-containing protein [Candidatus Bathyarchaeota archaeon]